MIAFVTLGIVVASGTSLYLANIHSRRLLIVIYHAPFRFWKPYLALYDRLESRYTFELLGGKKRFGAYYAFTAKYDELRPQAQGRFRRLWDVYAWQIGRDYGVVMLMSSLLFWKVWWVFSGTFLLIQAIVLFHLRYVKHYDVDLGVTTVVSVLLQDEQNRVK